jgi:hypothetical protein
MIFDLVFGSCKDSRQRWISARKKLGFGSSGTIGNSVAGVELIVATKPLLGWAGS